MKLVVRSLLLVGISLVPSSEATPARADSASDIDGWASTFQEAVASGSTDRIMASLDQVRDERLSKDGLRSVIESFRSNFKDTTVEFTTRISDEQIGDLYHRFTIAALYHLQHTYYTTTFMREASGWKLINLQMNTDLNKVLSQPWPQ